MSDKIRLIYFPLMGRAELPRWILSFAKADWEDVRVAREDWPKMKLGLSCLFIYLFIYLFFQCFLQRLQMASCQFWNMKTMATHVE